jgi:hypothetical protein
VGVGLGGGILVFLSGCFGSTPVLVPGTYAGIADCEISAPDGSGGEVSEPFTAEVTVAVGAQDSLVINGVPAAIGEMHARSIPTANLTLEVVAVQQVEGAVVVTYEPRPTLTGIEIDGTLVETYRNDENGLTAGAQADFILTDVDGPRPLSIECTALLTQ